MAVIQEARMTLAGELVAEAPLAQARRVVWLPSEQVLLLQISVPGRRWREALPWAVEPHVAVPVERQKLWPLHRERDGTTVCAVVDGALVARWRDQLSEAGWQDALLVPDCFSVQAETDWREMVSGERVLVRTGPWCGFAASRALVEAAASLAGATLSAGQPQALSWAALRPLSLHPLVFSEGRGLRGGQRVRRLGVALLSVLAVYLGQLAWETWQMNRQARTLTVQTQALFHQAFPQVHRLINLRAQVKQQVARMRQRQQATRWLAPLRKLAAAGARVTQLRLEGGRLRVRVRFASQAQAEQAARRLGVRPEHRRLLPNRGVEDQYVFQL